MHRLSLGYALFPPVERKTSAISSILGQNLGTNLLDSVMKPTSLAKESHEAYGGTRVVLINTVTHPVPAAIAEVTRRMQ